MKKLIFNTGIISLLSLSAAAIATYTVSADQSVPRFHASSAQTR